jgi:integrase
MKINRLQQPSRTETSYGEVKMNLFVPPGGKTKNWYVRVYVPAELLEFYREAEFKKSTRTSDRVLAEARAAAFALEKSREFLSKRDLLKGYTSGQPQTVVLDTSLIQKIAHIRLASLVRFDDEERSSMDEPEQWDEHDELIKLSLDDLKKLIARRKSAPGYERFMKTVIEFAQVMGYDIDKQDPMLAEFIDAMVRVEKRAYELMERRSQGELADLAEGESGPWLGELLQGWEKEHAPADPKTRSSYTSRIKNFIEFTDDKLVVAVEKKDVWDWLNKLLRVDKLAEKTITDGYLPALRSLFDYAVLSGKFGIKQSPAMGIQAPKLDKVESAARKKPRATFNYIYINYIFASVWYSGRTQPVGKLRTETVLAGNARYWVPLIACCQGLRAEEVCQLTLVDVGMQSGVFSIHITVESGRVKNEDSQRWVPVHKVLLDLGFAEYVESQRKQQQVPEAADMFVELGPGKRYVRPKKAGALFPELHTKFERKSNTLLQRFNDFLREDLAFENGYTFHSFRHYWEDSVRKTVASNSLSGHPWPKGMVERISGRSQAHLEKVEGSSAAYGGELPPSLMKPYLDQISFAKVVWPRPWAEFERS